MRFYSVEKVKKKDDDEDKKADEVTSAPSGPTSDFKKIEFSDVALFRLGYFEYMKINTANMLRKFESDKWYDVDLIFDWNEQRVSVYVNNKPLKSDSFFTQRKDKLKSGNALSIYGLSPDGVSYFKNLRMCNEICPFRK